MTAANHGLATAFLRRAGLFAGILAIIAGIFGMHVITGNHALHAVPAVAVTAADGTVQAESATAHGHAGHQAATAPQASGVHNRGVTSTQSCSCSGNCSGMQAMTVACVPSAKTGSLSAPLPGTAVFAVNVNAGTARPPAGHWSYFPGSPSPGDLSISRT